MSFSPTSITMNDAGQALRAGQAAIAQGIAVIDLSGLSSFDSSAVSAILAWQRDAARRGISLQVQGVPPGLHSLAGLYGVEHLLTQQ